MLAGHIVKYVRRPNGRYGSLIDCRVLLNGVQEITAWIENVYIAGRVNTFRVKSL